MQTGETEAGKGGGRGSVCWVTPQGCIFQHLACRQSAAPWLCADGETLGFYLLSVIYSAVVSLPLKVVHSESTSC